MKNAEVEMTKEAKKMEMMDRSTREGFIYYMMNRPYYFQDMFNRKATLENVISAFRETRQLRIIGIKKIN